MRPRLPTLLTLVAAFLIVPAGQAVAEHGEPHLKLNIVGEEGGGGEVGPASVPSQPGEPPIECNLPEGVGAEQEGVCENAMEEVEPEIFYEVLTTANGAGPNSEFVEWEIKSGSYLPFPGFCEDNLTCNPLAFEGEDSELNAIFKCKEGKECPGVPLTLKKAGSGRGSVVSSPEPDGIACGNSCDEETRGFVEGSTVTLTATPKEGTDESTFEGWHGADAEAAGCDPTGATTTCEVEMTEPLEVEATFDLLAEPPTVTTTEGATGITQTEATVAGTVNPNGAEATACKVEYGETTAYGSEASCLALPGSGTDPVAVEASLTGLSPETTYHFRVAATNAGGTGEGEDREFTTAAIVAPDVTTEAASPVGKTSATLNGAVDPNGAEVTACEFEYGETAAYGSTAPCVPAAPGSGTDPVAVHADVSGLTQTTEYHFRLTATNAGGTAEGADGTFTTSALAPPAVTTTAGAIGVTQTEATVHGTVNPNGTEVAACEVEYGETTGYGSTAPCVPAAPGSGTSPVPVEASLEGLSPDTTYHFRFTAVNADGTGEGPDRTFATLPPKPEVTIAAATGATPTALTLNGTVDPNGSNVTACEFEYGETTAYGSTAPCVPAAPGSGTDPVAVHADVGGLSPETSYHYRLTATNGGGSSTSGDETATTLPPPPAVTTTAGATAISQTEATVEGTVNPNGTEVVACEVEYGETTSYGSTAPCVPAAPGAGTAPVAVEASLEGLSPETTYHFRFTATNAGGTGNGPDRTFATLSDKHSLTTEQSGTGTGAFQCDAGSGPEACAASYPIGTEVTVIALPAASSELAEWSECAAPSANECEVLLDEDRSVEAIFTLKTLALSAGKTGTGSGTLTSSPAGIECGGDCSHTYDYGTEVTLTASPDTISDFAGWSGCDLIVAGKCKVTLTSAKAVTATFTARTHSLAIAAVGPGSGSVSCDGGPCASSYREGTTLTLRASAALGSAFFGWAGAGCLGVGVCVVTLNTDLTVTAAFEALLIPPPPVAGDEQSKPSPCAKPARRAKRFASRAKRLRANARKFARKGHSAKARRLRAKAKRYARRAKRSSRSAKRCRARRSRGTA